MNLAKSFLTLFNFRMKFQIKNSDSKALLYISISKLEIMNCKYLFIIMRYKNFYIVLTTNHVEKNYVQKLLVNFRLKHQY